MYEYEKYVCKTVKTLLVKWFPYLKKYFKIFKER